MDPIEKVIRNAFAKGDPDERAFREKVYRSAFAALKRTLAANPNVSPEVAEHRRTALLRKIAEIESEFLPALPPRPAAPAAGPAAETPRDAAPEIVLDAPPGRRREPRIDAPMRDDPAFGSRGDGDELAPRLDPSERASRDIEDEEYGPLPDDGPARRRGRGWATLFIGATVVAALGIGLWWAYDSGFFGPDTGGGFVPNPPITFDDEDYEPDEPAPRPPAQSDGLEGWIVVFEPSDPTLVAAPGGASAELRTEEGRSFVRIRSGPDGAPVLFDVGQGILERMAGQRVIFSIDARAEEGQETQISVDCDFGTLGDCGRKRYLVGLTQEEFLFEVELPNVRPGAGGTIAINSDVSNERRSVDIFAIRVSPAS